MVNNRSTFSSAPDLCKNISLAVVYYLIATVIHAVSYVHIYTHYSQYRDVGRAKEIKKMRQQWEPRAVLCICTMALVYADGVRILVGRVHAIKKTEKLSPMVRIRLLINRPASQ
jgi:hypothetical protein